MKHYRKVIHNNSGYFYAPYIPLNEEELKMKYEPEKTWQWYFWKFIHNAVVHPLLAFPWEPKWAQDFHDWTAKKCWGGG